MDSLKGIVVIGIAVWLLFLGGCDALQRFTAGVDVGAIQRGALQVLPTAQPMAPRQPIAPPAPPIVVTVVAPAPTPTPLWISGGGAGTLPAAPDNTPTPDTAQWRAPMVVPNKCRDWHPPMATIPECASPLLHQP